MKAFIKSSSKHNYHVPALHLTTTHNKINKNVIYVKLYSCQRSYAAFLKTVKIKDIFQKKCHVTTKNQIKLGQAPIITIHANSIGFLASKCAPGLSYRIFSIFEKMVCIRNERQTTGSLVFQK